MSYKCNQPQLPLVRDARKGGFNTGIHIVKECSEMPKDKPVIYMSLLTEAKKDAMMKEYPQREWLAYLQGRQKGKDWKVYDIVVPLQETTGGSVEVDKEADRPKDCIGTIHSHGKTDHATSFSGVDNDFLIGNYFVNIVTTGEHMTATVKITLPCGHYGTTSGEVIIEKNHINLTDWLTKAKDNIKDPLKKVQEAPMQNVQEGQDLNGINSWVKCSMCGDRTPFDKAEFTLHKGAVLYFCSNCTGYETPWTP